jgi:polysaccharide biosynthesis protein PslH
MYVKARQQYSQTEDLLNHVNTRMKILFIVPYVPNLIRVRPYQLIRNLTGQGHEITLATLWMTEEERADLQNIEQYCKKVIVQHLPRWQAMRNSLHALFTPRPLQSAYCWQPALAQSISRLLSSESFDVVHVEHLRGARYALATKANLVKQQHGTPVVWDSVDCISYLFQQTVHHSHALKSRLIALLDLQRTRRYESWLVGQFDRVLVTSATDKQALAALAQSIRTSTAKREMTVAQATGAVRQEQESEQRLEVISNGVDLEYFSSQANLLGKVNLVFTGKLSYHANTAAALHLVKEVMPSVWTQRPDATLWIVGKEPPAAVRALDRRNHTHRRVVVTGTVPDIRPYLQQASLAVAPLLYGAGIQNKLLEAMASGLAVVASPQAVTGLHAQGAASLHVATDAPSFAAAILHLIENSTERAALAARGRRYVEEHHSWPQVSSKLASVYRSAIAEKQGLLHAC